MTKIKLSRSGQHTEVIEETELNEYPLTKDVEYMSLEQIADRYQDALTPEQVKTSMIDRLTKAVESYGKYMDKIRHALVAQKSTKP